VTTPRIFGPIVPVLLGLTLGFPNTLSAQWASGLRPFTIAGLSTGDGNAWIVGGGVSMLSASAWELAFEGATYFLESLPFDGRYASTALGLHGHSKPLIGGRTYFLGGPEVWLEGPRSGFVVGAGFPVWEPGVSLELRAHVVQNLERLSIVLRGRW
jgi:hypothetical protein